LQTPIILQKTVGDRGNGGHFWIQHPKKHKVDQKYSMQLKKKYFCRPVLTLVRDDVRNGTIGRV
jgi:hypothetical protein